MNQDTIKSMLFELYKSDVDFFVTFTGKSSSKVNGLYKPGTHEILLHNKNFNSNNKLVYTAIHEYAHHLISFHSPTASSRVHSVEFWATFHDLLDAAEATGFYQLIANNIFFTFSLSVSLLILLEQIRESPKKKVSDFIKCSIAGFAAVSVTLAGIFFSEGGLLVLPFILITYFGINLRECGSVRRQQGRIWKKGLISGSFLHENHHCN